MIPRPEGLDRIQALVLAGRIRLKWWNWQLWVIEL